MYVFETYSPKKMTASGAIFANNGTLSHFLCTTSGSLSIEAGSDGAGTEVVPEFDVTEGVTYYFGFSFAAGCYANLTTAAGTFGYNA